MAPVRLVKLMLLIALSVLKGICGLPRDLDLVKPLQLLVQLVMLHVVQVSVAVQ